MGLMIKKVVSLSAGRSEGVFSSPGLTFCADSYSVFISLCVTTVACKRHWSFSQQCRWQVTPRHAYILEPTKLEWADYAV